MTQVTIKKTIHKRGLGYELFDGATNPDDEILVPIIFQTEEIAWDVKKSVGKIPFPQDKDTNTSSSVDFFFIDLKNVEEGIAVRGWIEDSVEVNSTATSTSSTEIIDSTQSWADDTYNNYYIKVYYAGQTQLRKITDTTSTTITVGTAFSPIPSAGVNYEIIFPAWTKFWILRAMCTTGGRLDNLIIGDTNEGGIDFDASLTGGDNFDPPGATLEGMTGLIGPDDTGEISLPLSDTGRINLNLILIFGDDIQNAL